MQKEKEKDEDRKEKKEEEIQRAILYACISRACTLYYVSAHCQRIVLL